MYAIIRTGGKQYKVQAGDVLQVEKLEQELGKEFDITEVLMIGGETSVIGQPLVKGAKVTVVVTKQARTRKVIVFKKRRRHGYRRLNTHKQDFTELFIKAISADGKSAKAETTPNVVDIAAVRTQRIADKQADRKARAEAAVGGGKAAAETLKAEAKKVAKKKVAKKATAKKAAKKPAKKAGAKKKAAKKATKK
ncbi:50S ribosomal protein L21 [Bdellovibrio sp. HCB337]|uniref:50S ribosomal protein L21 n=1 Tax=Bdellovibrio sp. HCB337 TaxID=3394358 RepID=UPI0039A74791